MGRILNAEKAEVRVLNKSAAEKRECEGPIPSEGITAIPAVFASFRAIPAAHFPPNNLANPWEVNQISLKIRV